MVSSFAFLPLLLSFSFSVNAQPYDYPTAAAPTTWTNSPSLRHTVTSSDGSTVRSLVLRLNPAYFGPSFAAGFYCFSPCKSFFLSVFIVNADSGGGIVYSPPAQVIWSANRANPVSENATLQLTSHSGLTLHDNDGSLVWSTSGVNRSVAGINVTESGNLVLFDVNNSSIWQSFDHPTDSLVLGQKLPQGMRLTANIAPTNWTESRLYLTLLANGLYAFVHSNPPQMYFQHILSINNTGNKSAYMEFMNGSFAVFSNYQENLITMPEASSVQFMRLDWDGHLRLYDYMGSSTVADLLNVYPDNCAYPTICGDYGICSDKQYCACPSENYFKPVNSRQGNMGCMLVSPISCGNMKNHELIAFDDMSYFIYVDSSSISFDRIDKESCKQLCLSNCTCKAAFFQYGSNSSDGSCYLPGEVFSLENNQPEMTHYNSSAYLKVQLTPSPPNNSSSLKGKKSKNRFVVLLGSTSGGAVLVLLIIGLFIMWLRSSGEEQEEDGIDQLPGMPTRFTFKELQVATENFARKLGEGGFGTVFEGYSHDERIAVKRLDNVGHKKKDFLTEVESIGSTHHINLVRLIGFCADKLNRLLVYEYMCNGSLDKWIYGSNESAPLDWPTRYKIITDIAKGLCYLHDECRQRILHLDIKPANILLDENFNAKISDFGLSKLIDRAKSRVMTGMRGTPGYLAPEWMTAMVNEKVDVYSFGVVVMEILSGRKNLDYSQNEECSHLIALLEEKCKSNQVFDLIDKNLSDVKLYEEEIMKVMELAMWCLQWDSCRRPKMSLVIKVLEGAMEMETSLNYNFVSLMPMIPNAVNQVDQVDQSASILASVLSGPR